MDWQSQIAQDKFVDVQMGQKENGTFLDIGCGHYKAISNTYALEKGRNWWGVGIDIDHSFTEGWQFNRPDSLFVCCDGLKVDYKKLIARHYQLATIDYLTIDLEPPVLALDALKLVLATDVIFNCVTFEHDYYRQKNTRDTSRELMKEAGYILCVGSPQDDFYIHKQMRGA